MKYNLIFENWRRFLKEEQEVPLTPEQNRALKAVYVAVRNELNNLKNFLNTSHPELINTLKQDPENYDARTKIATTIRRQYVPTENFEKVGNAYKLKTANKFSSFLPEMDPDFQIKFSNDRTVQASITGGHLIINPISLVTVNELSFKSIIQHEMEHLVHMEGTGGTGIVRDEGEEAFHKSVVAYMTSGGEIQAHAKQYAYIYYKTFPEDKEVDLDKLQDLIKRQLPMFNRTVEAYLLWFALKSDVSKYYNDEEKQLAKKASEKFVHQLNWYFNNYKQKD